MKPTLLTLFVILGCFSQVTAQKTDSIPPPWNEINLTGRYMKPHAVEVMPHPPLHRLLIEGGVVIVSGTLAHVLTEDKPAVAPQLLTKDDIISISCHDSAIVDVLINDRGEGLFISSVSAVSQATIEVLAGKTRLMISNITSFSNFSFTIIIKDKHGQLAHSIVLVNVDSSPIIANNDEYEIAFGQTLTTNILANDSGQGLRVTDYTQPDGGMVSITEAGVLSFSSANNFEGTTSFVYTVADNCHQSTRASVMLIVHAPHCDFEATVTSIAAHCGEQDGQVTINISPDGVYVFDWSNGSTTANELLNSGNHMVTITSADGFCTQEMSVFIDEVSAEFDVTFETISSNCGLNNGEISAMVTPEDTYFFNWSNDEIGPSVSNLTASQYSVTITNAAGCSNEFLTGIHELADTYLTSINTNPGNCLDGGNIFVTLTTPGDGPIIIDINGPNGDVQLSLQEGTHSLFSEMNIASGDYSLLVYDQNAGVQCAQTVTTTVADNTLPLVANNDSFNTGFGETITANVLINDTGQGLNILGYSQPNGGAVSMGINGVFTFIPTVGFTGMTAFIYTLEGICFEPKFAMVSIVIGPPGTEEVVTTSAVYQEEKDQSLIVDTQLGMMTSIGAFFNTRNREMPFLEDKKYSILQGISFTASYLLANQSNETRVTFFPNMGRFDDESQAAAFIRFEQMLSLLEVRKNTWSGSLNGGFSAVVFHSIYSPQAHWQFNTRINKKILKDMNLELSLSVRGWKTVQQPILDIGLFVPIKLIVF